MIETDVRLPGGRILHAYSWGDGDRVVLWHHGTPNIGRPPEPLFAAATILGLRFIAYDRPGYGGSTPSPGRDIASAATDAAAVADALGAGEFAVMGHSGGGPHALACAALLPARVTAAVSISGLAPHTAAGLDWFAGMGPGSLASLQAAAAGRAAKETYAAAPTVTDPDFTDGDWAALEGVWGWFGSVVEPAIKNGPAPLIDDDLAYVGPWGFDPATITTPVLLVHGGDDLMVPSSHSAWLAGQITNAELRVVPGAGHISVLPVEGEPALGWIPAVTRTRKNA
ncbi:pimeloyl-ACP methyl ester carboxylesterase [Actinoplanes lutulentus]|uniref:alpha/beta fold hydrolase n=1 Tax=Actinoplanes lutulentus TaxID=1287878 RepID=UPI0017F8D64F|nr:alpha/beta hydrolase [Actinoplanes lutulentus]MBB2946834.1 pimeloyl-ACP methyl ester carboxylesterase [Actinoplanes lutulentus]